MRTLPIIVAASLTSLLLTLPAAAQQTPPPPPSSSAPQPPLPPPSPPQLGSNTTPTAVAPNAFTPLPPPPLHSSRATMITGMVIVGVAAATSAAAFIVAFAPSQCDNIFCASGRWSIGGMMLASSMGLGGLGAAMWAAGGSSPKPDKQPSSSLKPSIGIGPGTASLTWTF